MEARKIGFIGLGEVGRTFARAMNENGAEVYYFDVVRKNSHEGIPFLPMEELVQRCDVLLATVVSQAAVEVAREACRHLKPGKLYADLNSTSGSVKREVAKIIEASGADFVEGAILSAVGETGAKASILVSGKKAEAFARLMNELGLVHVRYFSPRVGDASTVKMVRSIFSKGMECLLIEMLVAGKRAGVSDDLWKEIVQFMTEHPFERVAENWIRTHPVACERRYHEMIQVVETVWEMGLEPIMAKAAVDFFKRSLAVGLPQAFPEKPARSWEVVDRLEKELKP
jgi:3-hydroxyisobutyrate dehydrogenase-like beta-hydroxyacid dehydrogenase